MQKFLKDTLESRYIKALLYGTYIPKYNSVRIGDKIIAGTRYVFRSNIILCTTTGLLGSSAKYKVVAYVDNRKINRKTFDNFLSKEKYYDYATHERLGEFLRYYRGATDVNLMPLYNCFSGRYNSNFSIDSSGIIPVSSPNNKIIEVPIKFNQTYTIAIDCANIVYVAPAFLDNDDYLFVGDVNVTTMIPIEKQVQQFASLSFSNPVTYKIENDDEFLQRFEKKLTLLIQVPFNCDSSIVVLEGDYTTTRTRKTINVERVDTISETSIIPKGRVSGDIDGDGRIMQSDYYLLNDYINGTVELDEVALYCAELVEDGVIDIKDYEKLEQFVEQGNTNYLHRDYWENWEWDETELLWKHTLSVQGAESIEDITGYNIEKFEIVSQTSVNVFVTIPPLNDCTIWISKYSGGVKYNWQNSLSANDKDSLFISNLSLLRINDRQTYAFSDKLISYLLSHTITNREEIVNNVLRIQNAIDIDKYFISVPDAWDDNLRKVLFDTYMKEYPNGIDILGYADNDIERMLLKKGYK